MLKIYYYIIFTFCTVAYCNAQVGNVWHFGHGGGFDFNTQTGGIVPRTNNNSIMLSDEGCASISDTSGNLLFYSNGRKVFNKLHQLMKNGDSLNGNISSFQSVVIVPHPGNPNLYYLFTSDAFENNFALGYQYHLVDITADNGNGSVISKNNNLFASGTERLTVVQHANGNDVWVITNDNNSNIFRSWPVTCNGLQLNPVISTVGIVLDSFSFMNVGSLKVSPDGSKLCQTHFPELDILNTDDFFQLFDFNAATGVLSNPQKLTLQNKHAYCSSFSPNGKLLYLTDPNHPFFYQLDISLGNTAAILNSLESITSDYGFYGIQQAPDDKIYLTRYGLSISAINNPDKKGSSCNFILNAIPIPGARSQINLPAFINNAFSDPFNNFSYSVTDTCTGTIQFNAITNMGGIVNYWWTFGDGTNSQLQNPTHVFTPKNRLYNIQLKITSNINCAPVYRSKILSPQGILVIPDFNFTVKCDSAKVSFTNKTITYPYTDKFLWNFGDNNFSNLMNPVHIYTTISNFMVTLKVMNNSNCITDSITKNLNMQPATITAPADRTINENEQITLTSFSNANQFEWTPSTYLNNATLLSPVATPLTNISYVVTAKNDANCIARDTVNIKVNPIKDIYIPTVFTPNGDGKNDFFYPTFSRTFQQIIFTVYNRWGQEVFRGTPQNNFTWNGISKNKPVATGTYVWKFSAVLSNGVPIKKTGTLLVLK